MIQFRYSTNTWEGSTSKMYNFQYIDWDLDFGWAILLDFNQDWDIFRPQRCTGIGTYT